MKGRRLLLHMLVILTLVLSGSTRAQSELLDLAEQACRSLGRIQGLEWICYAAQLPTNVLSLVQELHTDLAAFSEELLNSWLQDALATIGQRVGSERLTRAFAEVRDAISQGPVQLRAAIGEIARQLRLENASSPRAPEHSPDWWGEQATRVNPNLAAANEVGAERKTQVAITRAETAAVHEANLALAQEAQDAAATQDAVLEVLRPPPPGLTCDVGMACGTAARLEDRARKAVSSRAALVVLTEGIADLMRQDAVFSGAIIEHLRVLSQQQVMTTWQLHLAVNTLTEQLAAEVAKDQAALQRRVSRAYETGRRLGTTFAQLAEHTGDILEPDLSALSWESVGW
jgi:hypothetical protein